MAGNLKLTGIIETKARKILKTVCRILDDNDIPYVLEGGTLLGIIRENRLLPWDNDVDITITQPYMEKFFKIRWKIWMAGYRTRIRISRVEMPNFPIGSVRLINVQTHKHLVKKLRLLDVFVKYKFDDQYYWTVGIKNPVLKSAPAHFYEEIDKYEFDGYLYSIPKDFDGYLTHRYGEWKKPVKEYDFKNDDKAIIFKHKSVSPEKQ